MFDGTEPSAQLEDLEMPVEIRPDIGARVFERIADAGLGRQVNHLDNFSSPDGIGQRAGVGNV